MRAYLCQRKSQKGNHRYSISCSMGVLQCSIQARLTFQWVALLLQNPPLQCFLVVANWLAVTLSKKVTKRAVRKENHISIKTEDSKAQTQKWGEEPTLANRLLHTFYWGNSTNLPPPAWDLCQPNQDHNQELFSWFGIICSMLNCQMEMIPRRRGAHTAHWKPNVHMLPKCGPWVTEANNCIRNNIYFLPQSLDMQPILNLPVPMIPVAPKWQLPDPVGTKIPLEVSSGEGTICSLTLQRQQPTAMGLYACAWAGKELRSTSLGCPAWYRD